MLLNATRGICSEVSRSVQCWKPYATCQIDDMRRSASDLGRSTCRKTFSAHHVHNFRHAPCLYHISPPPVRYTYFHDMSTTDICRGGGGGGGGMV